MGETIDCLIIGHNEMNFSEYKNTITSMDQNSEAFRDLNYSFIEHDNRVYTISDVFNQFYNSTLQNGYGSDLSLGEAFSATIAYLGTYLNRRGLTFDYVNSFQDEKQELIEKLTNQNIHTVAIPTTLYILAFPIVEIVELVRKYNPDAKIIIGGPFVSRNVRTQEELILQYVFDSIGADYYINSSQGENALVNLVKAIRENSPISGIANIHYRQGDTFMATPVEKEDNCLEENMVDWSLFADRIGRFANIRTAISCPFSCSFCGFPKHAGKYQTASVAAVEGELNRLHTIGKVKSLHFIDDTFNVPPERIKEILRMMIRNKYDFNWHSHFRCQFADDEMVELMKESGCEGVFLGIESGSPQILKNMNKAATVENYRRGMKFLKKHNILTHASFIIGFPGETEETVKETVCFIEECQPDFFRTLLWYCEPITPIWEQREKYKIEGSQFNWSHETMNSQMACDIIEEIFLTVKKSTWLPQYNFDFDSIFHLADRGMSRDAVKEFVSIFNWGIREKLIGYRIREKRKKVIFDADTGNENDTMGGKTLHQLFQEQFL